ncbi:retrovirus-related pol polyprotein from transposon TNT 1-94 [Tanacetum coccineum]
MFLCVCPVVGFTRVDTLADMNIPVNDVPAEQAPAIAPPIKTDDQILPFWDTIDALQITPTNDNDPFVAPPSSDTIIKYVNPLGYPSTLKNVSAMSINSLYQPWRAIFSMINMCLTDKTAGYDRRRHPVIHRSNIDYAERIWEEFIQSIQTFLTHQRNLTTAAHGKKKSTPLLIPSIRFTKLIIHYLKTKNNIYPRTNSPLHYSHDEIILGSLRSVGKDGREIFGMPIHDALLINEIKREPYYGEYLEHVAKYQQYLDEEHGKVGEEGVTESPKATKVRKPKAAKQIKPSTPKAAKLVDEFVDEGVPEKEPVYGDEEANLQQALELSLKDQGEQTQGPPRPMVFKEPDFRRFQPLPEVQDEAVIDLIHQDSSSVPLMTIMVIDLSLLHSVSIIVHALLPTSTSTTTTITTTTYLPKPPPQP